jgi:hypothetical protein
LVGWTEVCRLFGWMNEWIDGLMEGWIVEWIDGRMVG